MARQYTTRLIIQGDAEGGIRAIRATESELAKLDKKNAASAANTKRAARSMNSSLHSIATTAKYAAGSFVLFGATDSIKRLIDANIALQKINNELAVSTKTAAGTAREFQFVSDVSNKLGLDLETTASAYARLAGSAKSAGISQTELHKGFTGLADAFAVLHSSTEDVSGVLIQLEQGLSLGKIQMTDLRAVSQHLPGVFELVKKSFDDSGQSMQKMLQSGGIPAEQFFKRFTAALANKYGPQAQKAALGLQGSIARLDNAFFSIESSGNVGGLATSIDGLATTLNSPETRQGLQALAQDMIDISASAVTAASKIDQVASSVNSFFKPLSDSLNYVAGGGAANDIRGALGFSTNAGKPAPAGGQQHPVAVKPIQVEASKAIAHHAPALHKTTTAANKLSAAYANVNGQLSQQIALFGKTSETAQITYQVEHGNLSNLSDQRKQSLLQMAQQIDRLKAQKAAVQSLFPEWQKLQQASQLKQQVSHLPANMQQFGQRRAAQMVKDSATSGLPQVQGLAPQYNGPFGEANRMQAEQQKYEQAYQQRLDSYRTYAATHKQDVQTANQAIAALEQDHQKRSLTYQQQIEQAKQKGYESLYGNLTSIVGTFAGKQSGIYKGMFIAEKAYAFASTMVHSQAAIAKAWDSGPFPENLAAVAVTIAKTGALDSLISGATLSGQAHAGIDNVPKDGTWYLQGGERVINRGANQDLTRYLQRANQQHVSSTKNQSTNITVNVQAQPGVSNADAHRQGQAIAKGLRDHMRGVILDEKRPGGLLSTG